MYAEWGPEFAEAEGTMPDWYPVISAARYLGVPPWELVEQPSEWMDWALAAQSAESEARGAGGRKAPPRSGPKPFKGLG